MKKLLLLSLFGVYQIVFSQGIIRGVVTDKDMSGEPLAFANVFVKGTTIGSTTEMDGTYSISVSAGKQTVVFSFVGYETVEKTVEVKNGQTLTLNQEMGSGGGSQLDNIEIKARVNREREAALLLEQKKAVTIQTKIGAQELSRKGVGDAQAAVAKVSGISRQEGVKNVFVRGLGDRYNSTSLNGFPIPSEDPEYKNISLDFFETDVIKNIEVSKVFSSKIFGDVGGANINVASKELNTSSELEIDISGGTNTQILKNDFYEQDGVDYFGFSNSEESGEDMTKFNFPNKLNYQKKDTPYNHSFGISAGKRFNFEDGSRLSLLLVGSHSVGHSYTDEQINYATTEGITERYTGKKSSKYISQVGFTNALYRFGESQIAYNFMLIHNNSQYVGDYEGKDDNKFQSAYDDESGLIKRQRNNDNTLMVNQLISNFKLTDFINLEAGFSYGRVKGLEPDRRINTFSKNSPKGDYLLTGGTGKHFRYFITLIKDDYNARLSLSHKLNTSDKDDKVSKISFGYDGRIVIDDFKAIEYDFTAVSGAVKSIPFLDIDALYNQANLDAKKFRIDRNSDVYDVNKNTHAGFVDFTYQVMPELVANVGARVEDVNLRMDYRLQNGDRKGIAEIKKSYVFLPSVNLKYNLTNKSSFRLGSSKTYTLPQSKEISPYRYIDANFKSEGEEDLKPSESYNLDLKWEYFMTTSELLSLTGFHKYIAKPIARIEEGSSGGYLTYENIAKNAKVLGLELEFRKHLLNSALDENYEGDGSHKLTAGLNASYIHSELDLEVDNTPKRKSKLEGASPFLANADLTFSLTTKGGKEFINSLVLNYFSDRIYTIGTIGYDDIMEKGIVGLDFVSSSEIIKNLTLKIRAKNILNQTHELFRKSKKGRFLLNSYKKGIDLSLGLSYKF